MLRAFFVLPLAFLSACATIVNGSSQTVTVSTEPPAATCTLDRMGQRVAAIAATPASVRIDKSKNDLSVTCGKAGYQQATVVHAPSFSGATFGNIIAGGVIGVVVDASSGANYSYPSDIRLALAATPPPSVALPPISLAPQAPGTGLRAIPVAARTSQPGAY